MSSVLEKIKKRSSKSDNYVYIENYPEQTEKKNMSISSSKISRLQVREGKRNDGSKIALVTLIPDLMESERCGIIPERPASSRGWDHEDAGSRRHLRRDSGRHKSSKCEMQITPTSESSATSFYSVDKADVSLVVTHYEDPCTFWAQNCDDADDVLGMEYLLELNLPPITAKENLKKNEMYVTTNVEDGKTYRCKIVHVISEEECLVRYIDFGNTEVVYRNQFSLPSDELKRYPSMAKRYRLYRLKPHTGLKAKAMQKEVGIGFLKKYIPDDLVQGRVVAKELNDLIPVKIKIEGRDLGAEVISRDYATHVKPKVKVKSPRGKGKSEIEEKDLSDKSCATESYYQSCVSDEGIVTSDVCASTSTESQMQQIRSSPEIRTPVRSPLSSPVTIHRDDKVTVLKNRIAELEKINMETMLERDDALAELDALKVISNPCGIIGKNPQTQEDENITFRAAISKMQLSAQKEESFQPELKSLIDHFHQVRLLRKQIPFSADQADPIENMCLFIQQHMDRINLDEIVEMMGINTASEDYNAAQQAIGACANKEQLSKLIVNRDAARVVLHGALSQFVNEIGGATLIERHNDLLTLKKNLGDVYGVFMKVKTSSCPNMDALMAKYREWKELYRKAFVVTRQETNAHHAALLNTWNLIRNCLLWTSDNKKLSFDENDVLAQMQNLKKALAEELSTCSVEKIGGYSTLAMIVQKLNGDIDEEINQIEEIKKLQQEYSQMIAALTPWLDKPPDFNPLLNLDQEIKALKSQLRHKLADLSDLEEEPSLNKPVMEQLNRELTAIRNKLHVAFATGDRLSAKFAQVSKVHYPELRLLYPSLDHEILSSNIVKEGRELSYYDLDPFHSVDEHVVVYRTRILENDFVLKEYILDKMNVLEFINRVMYYANLSAKELVPISAILCPKDKLKLYLQMPYYEYNLLERNNLPFVSLEVKCRILVSVAKGLAKLHAHNIIHGAVNPKNVLVSEDEAFLAPYNFNTNLYQRVTAALKAEPINGVSFLAPELLANRKRISTSADVYALGCIALILFYAKTEFESDKYKIPTYSHLEDSNFVRLVSKLLDKDPEKRITAEQVAVFPELQNPCAIFKAPPVLEPVACNRLSTPLFVFTEEERREMTVCVSHFSVSIRPDSGLDDKLSE